MISKRAFARRIASIHIASNIDYTKIEAIGFSEDNLADEMASILFNLVTQTPMWRKSEKILVEQFESEGVSAFTGGNARRIRRKNSLLNRLSSQISNQDISRALDSLYDYDEMKELIKSNMEDRGGEFPSGYFSPYLDPVKVLNEDLMGERHFAYSEAISFLNESVLPMVARRYFPQYLASKMPDIAKRVSSRNERRKERARQRAQESESNTEAPVRRVVHPRVRVRRYFSTNPLASEIEAEIRTRTFSVLNEDELLADMVEEAKQFTSFSPRGSFKARKLRDKVKAEAKNSARDIVATYLDGADPSMFVENFPSKFGDETRALLIKEGRKYLQGMRARLQTISSSIIEREVLKDINQLNLAQSLTKEEQDALKEWETKFRR